MKKENPIMDTRNYRSNDYRRWSILTLVKMPSEDIESENSLVVDLEKLNKRKRYWIVKRCLDCIGAL